MNKNQSFVSSLFIKPLLLSSYHVWTLCQTSKIRDKVESKPSTLTFYRGGEQGWHLLVILFCSPFFECPLY